MILYEVFPNKKLKILEDENTYITENLISSVHIKLPSTFGDYPVKELTAELRFYFPEGDYMAYTVDTQQACPEVPITNDITEKPQTLSVMLFFYKGGNVIGKTNSVDKVIHDAPLKGEPLTPRAEFDEVIAEQRETIAEQAETITEQAGTISSQGEQITELSGEVTELTTENTRLEALTETQRETIQNMLENPPQPQLYTPPEPIIPESETRVYTPPQNYDGFASFTVKGTSLINPELSVYFKRETPIDLIFNQGVIYDYICYGNTAIRSINFSENVYRIGASSFTNCTGVSEINFSVGLDRIDNEAFAGCSNLIQIKLPHGLRSIAWRAFQSCTNLKTIFFPNSLISSNEATMLANCQKLQNVALENGFNSNGLHLENSILYTVETIVACLEALADRTGQTAYTITFGTTNLNKLTAEQKAIATNKNWNLA